MSCGVFWSCSNLVVTRHEEIVLEPRVPSYGVIPVKAQFIKEEGLPSWFSVVERQGEWVRV